MPKAMGSIIRVLFLIEQKRGHLYQAEAPAFAPEKLGALLLSHPNTKVKSCLANPIIVLSQVYFSVNSRKKPKNRFLLVKWKFIC